MNNSSLKKHAKGQGIEGNVFHSTVVIRDIKFRMEMISLIYQIDI